MEEPPPKIWQMDDAPKPAQTKVKTAPVQSPPVVETPQIMSGFRFGMDLMSHDRSLIQINSPGRRSTKPQDMTIAKAGMGVYVRQPGMGFGYIVGANNKGNLMVWLKKSQQVREVSPSVVEQDKEMRKLGRIIDAIRRFRAQNMDPTKPVAPGSAPPISNVPPPPGAPNLPVGSDGKPLGIGSGVQMTQAPGDPKGEGTVTEINPDGSFLYTSTQGTPEAVKPGEKTNVKVIPPAPGQSGIPGQSPG